MRLASYEISSPNLMCSYTPCYFGVRDSANTVYIQDGRQWPYWKFKKSPQLGVTVNIALKLYVIACICSTQMAIK